MHQHLWAEARQTNIGNAHKRWQTTVERESYRRVIRNGWHCLKKGLTQATNPNIQRMRRSELANAEADYQRRIQEFDEAMEKADITAEPVAYGILEVENGV